MKRLTPYRQNEISLSPVRGKGMVLFQVFQLRQVASKVTPKTKSSYQRSQEDKKAGRIEKFSSSEEMFKSLGI